MTETDMLAGTRRGDKRAFAALVAAHEGILLAHVRKRIAALSYDDLYQAALFGLWRAAVCYDPTKGTKFTTHAWRRVRAEVRRCVAKFAGDVHMGDEGTQKGRILRATHYQDDAYSELGGVDYFARSQPEQERAVGRVQARRAIRAAVERLAPRARAVVEARWLSGPEPLSMDETKERVGFDTKAWTQRVHSSAVMALSCNPSLRALADDTGLSRERPIDPKRCAPKLAADAVERIRKARAEGVTLRDLAKLHGVSKSCIQKAVSDIDAPRRKAA